MFLAILKRQLYAAIYFLTITINNNTLCRGETLPTGRTHTEENQLIAHSRVIGFTHTNVRSDSWCYKESTKWRDFAA